MEKYSCKFARMLRNGETKPCCYVLGYGECQFLCEVSEGRYKFDIQTIGDCKNALVTMAEGEHITLPKENMDKIDDIVNNCEYMLTVVHEEYLIETIQHIKECVLKVADKLNESYGEDSDISNLDQITICEIYWGYKDLKPTIN